MKQWLHMGNSKNGALFLFIGSVVLIFVAIIFTAVIDRTKQSSGSDPRARASKPGSLTLLGQVQQYDDTNAVLIVSNVQFADTRDKSLGDWSVTPPAAFSPTSFPPGTKIKITASPATFQISSKTVTATAIDRR